MTPQMQKLLDDLRDGKIDLKPNLDGDTILIPPGGFTYTGMSSQLKPLKFKVCQHPNMPTVPFDVEAAKGLDAMEVRKRWPRVWTVCPDCKEGVMSYASYEHYLAGDW